MRELVAENMVLRQRVQTRSAPRPKPSRWDRLSGGVMDSSKLTHRITGQTSTGTTRHLERESTPLWIREVLQRRLDLVIGELTSKRQARHQWTYGRPLLRGP